MFESIREAGVDPGKLIIVTHDRLFRIHEEMDGILCHLFGHRHGFKHTVSKGTHFVNVSALDRIRTVIPKECVKHAEDLKYPPREKRFNVNAGSYCIIEFSKDGNLSVIQKDLWTDKNRRWAVTDHVIIGRPWIPEDEQFA